MLREIFALTTGCRDGFRLFSTAQVITSRQRLPVIHYYNTNVRRANTSFPILRIEKYFYVLRARVRSTRNDGREISFQTSFSLMFSLEHRSMQRLLHIGWCREDARANRVSRDVIVSSIHLPSSSVHTPPLVVIVL